MHPNRTTIGEPPSIPPRPEAPSLADEEGSLVSEYGLITIVGATIASLVIKWAASGAIWQLFNAVTTKVRVLMGA